jgi:hypothetical protein
MLVAAVRTNRGGVLRPVPPCCTDRVKPEAELKSYRCLCYANRLRTSEIKHAVQEAFCHPGAPAFGDDPEMLVTLRWGGLNDGTRYHPLTRWHNHRSTRVTLSNCTINVVSVVSPIAGE